MDTVRKLIIATAIGAAAVFLSGCYVIVDDNGSQADVIGDVVVNTSTCISGAPIPSGTCPPGNANSASNGFTNFLIAYRVPDATSAPDTLTGTGGITFDRDGSYTNALTAASPPPAGQHWVGYRSRDTNSTPAATTDFTTHFRLLQPDGSPFQGPFKFRTVSGWFWDHDGSSGGSPIDCGPDPSATYPSSPGPDQVNCIDSPTSASPGDKPWETDTAAVPTRDLAVTGGTSYNVAQGGDIEIPFSADFAGAQGPTFSIDALTNLKDSPVTPSATSLTPAADSKNPITVRVHVDPTNSPGTYEVKLVAKLDNGQTREHSVAVVVAAGRPVVLTLPDVTGTFAVGQTIACSHGDWTGSPANYGYEWLRDGSPIAGATSSQYELTTDDGANLIACRVTASNVSPDVGIATSHAYRVAQEGGSDVDLGGRVSIKRQSNGLYLLNTGITIACPARLPKNCGAGTQLTADRHGTVGKAGMSVKSGDKKRVVLHLTRAGGKLLDKDKSLRLTADVTTRSHSLERVESRKSFTARSTH